MNTTDRLNMRKAIGMIILYFAAMGMVFFYGLRSNNTLIMAIVPLVGGITIYKFLKSYREVNKEDERKGNN